MIFDLGSTAVLVGQFAFIYVLILCAFEQRDSYNQVARNETKVCFFFSVCSLVLLSAQSDNLFSSRVGVISEK